MSIIPKTSALYSALEAASHKRMVFFAGLPGVGKSFYVKELATIAHHKGRQLHFLQWDVTRSAFESPEILARYPEVEGVTHLAIRKAVGLWARQALLTWHNSQPSEAILIGEVPLIGNRLIELVEPLADASESLLASDACLFITPVPSQELRTHIEAARELSIANPKHEREKADASPQVLRGLWLQLYQQAYAQGLTPLSPSPNPAYDPELYASLYQHLLTARHAQSLYVNERFKATQSVYEVPLKVQELQASSQEVAQIMQYIEKSYS